MANETRLFEENLVHVVGEIGLFGTMMLLSSTHDNKKSK